MLALMTIKPRGRGREAVAWYFDVPGEVEKTRELCAQLGAKVLTEIAFTTANVPAGEYVSDSAEVRAWLTGEGYGEPQLRPLSVNPAQPWGQGAIAILDGAGKELARVRYRKDHNAHEVAQQLCDAFNGPRDPAAAFLAHLHALAQRYPADAEWLGRVAGNVRKVAEKFPD